MADVEVTQDNTGEAAEGIRTALAFDYQSDRHCAKTGTPCGWCRPRFDYQSDRHCAKTEEHG